MSGRAQDKALALIADKRIRLDRQRSSKHRYVFLVAGQTNPLAPYEVAVEYDGFLVYSCTCENGLVHPTKPKCSHRLAAQMLCEAFDGPERIG